MVTDHPDAQPEQPETAPDLSHLHPSVRQVALLPTDQRLALIRADRWIGYPKATEAVARLEELLTWPTRQRMPNMLLIGPTNNGKSMIIEKFRRVHPPEHEPNREYIPVLCIQMPPSPSPPRFYAAILNVLVHRSSRGRAPRSTSGNRSPSISCCRSG